MEAASFTLLLKIMPNNHWWLMSGHLNINNILRRIKWTIDDAIDYYIGLRIIFKCKSLHACVTGRFTNREITSIWHRPQTEVVCYLIRQKVRKTMKKLWKINMSRNKKRKRNRWALGQSCTNFTAVSVPFLVNLEDFNGISCPIHTKGGVDWHLHN